MHCVKCDKHLSQCTCPDLKERLEKLGISPNLYISPEAMAIYEKQAEKNKQESGHAE